MFKKTKDAAQPELVTSTISSSNSAADSSADNSVERRSSNAGVNSGKSSSAAECPVHGHPSVPTKPLLARFSLVLTASLFAFVLCATNCWLEAGTKSDIRHTSDWDQYVAKLSSTDAKLMEIRLVLDDIKAKYFSLRLPSVQAPWARPADEGDWYSPPITDVPTKVRLAKFYILRENRPAALVTFERAFKTFDSNTEGSSYYEWKDWAVLCRLYIEQGRFDDAARVIDRMFKWNSALDSAKPQFSPLHELAVQAYEATGQKEKASHFRTLIDKATKSPERSRDWELDKTAVEAYGDVRADAYDYALSLLFEGRGGEAASKLEELSRDMKAANAGGESFQFRASLNMMIPVAYVAAANWNDAAKNFPRALRLADQQKYAPCCHDAKLALYRAYARFLRHGGQSEEAANYARMATEMRDAAMSKPVNFTEKSPVNKFDPVDLFGRNFKPSEEK